MLRLFFLLVLFSIFINCSSDIVKKRDIIEDDKFQELLIDFHKAEGIITIAKLNSKKKKNDTISPYNYILKKHNISRHKFDKTIEYYSNHTEEYVVFYDSINNYFLKQKKDIEELIEVDTEKIKATRLYEKKNLWDKKREWKLDGISKKELLKFNIPVERHGIYTIIYDVQTKLKFENFKERITIFVNYEDGTSKSSDKVKITDNLKKEKLKGYKHIELSIKTNKNKKLKSISGYIINYKLKAKQNFHIKNIEIKYKEKKNNFLNIK